MCRALCHTSRNILIQERIGLDTSKWRKNERDNGPKFEEANLLCFFLCVCQIWLYFTPLNDQWRYFFFCVVDFLSHFFFVYVNEIAEVSNNVWLVLNKSFICSDTTMCVHLLCHYHTLYSRCIPLSMKHGKKSVTRWLLCRIHTQVWAIRWCVSQCWLISFSKDFVCAQFEGSIKIRFLDLSILDVYQQSESNFPSNIGIMTG